MQSQYRDVSTVARVPQAYALEYAAGAVEHGMIRRAVLIGLDLPRASASGASRTLMCEGELCGRVIMSATNN